MVAFIQTLCLCLPIMAFAFNSVLFQFFNQLYWNWDGSLFLLLSDAKGARYQQMSNVKGNISINTHMWFCNLSHTAHIQGEGNDNV